MDQDNRTVVTDIDIPFFRLVAIIIKISLAAVPAMIIVWFIMALVATLFGGLIGGGNLMWMHSRGL